MIIIKGEDNMRKIFKICVGIGILIILLMPSALCFNIKDLINKGYSNSLINNQSKMWYVDIKSEGPIHDGSYDHPFKNINDSLTFLESNKLYSHSIYVFNGTYNEKYQCLTIDFPVNLIGEDKSNTIIDINGKNRIIVITSSYVNIEGFSIINGGNYDGIVILPGSNQYLRYIEIRNCIITKNYNGIACFGRDRSSNDRVSIDQISINRCIISDNNNDGIWSEHSDIRQIANCNIKYNWNGIHLKNSRFSIIMTNIVNNNSNYGLYVNGDSAIENCGYVISNNSFENNKNAGVRFEDSIMIVYLSYNNFINNNGGRHANHDKDQIGINVNNFDAYVFIFFVKFNYWNPTGKSVITDKYIYIGDFKPSYLIRPVDFTRTDTAPAEIPYMIYLPD